MAYSIYEAERETKEPNTSNPNAHKEYVLSSGRGLFPPGLRWVNYRAIIFVRPPMKQLVEYAPTDKYTASNMAAESKVFAEVSFPWSIYCIEPMFYLDSISLINTVGFSNSDPMNDDDIIYDIALPNLMRRGLHQISSPLPLVCEARSSYTTIKWRDSFLEKAYEKTSSLWESAWNDNAYKSSYHGTYLDVVGYESWSHLLQELDGKTTSKTAEILQGHGDSRYIHELRDLKGRIFSKDSVARKQIMHNLTQAGVVVDERVAR